MSGNSAHALHQRVRYASRRGRRLHQLERTLIPGLPDSGSDSPSISNIDHDSDNTSRVEDSPPPLVDSSREETCDKLCGVPSPTRKRVGKEEWLWELVEAKRGGLVSTPFLDGMIMNYLIVQGHQAAAEMFELEAGVQPDIDLHTIEGRVGVCHAILRGDTATAIELCNDFDPSFLESNTKLQYELHLQRTIDLINNRDAETALDYSAKHLTPLIRDHSDPSLEKRLEEALLLLVLPSSDDLVKELLSNTRRVELAHLINCAILSHQNPKQTWPSVLGGDSQISDFIRLVIQSQERLAAMNVDVPQIQGLCQE